MRIFYLKDTWSVSESLLPSPERGLAIEYTGFGRVASNDPPLFCFLPAHHSSPPFFPPTATSLIIKKKENRAAILPSKFFRALLAAALDLSATSQKPFQCLTASLEPLQRKQRTSNHCGLDFLCPKREIYTFFYKSASRIKI